MKRKLHQRSDIIGNSDARQETISEYEERYRPWEFTATFDPLLHTDLVRIVNDRREVSPDYIESLFNQHLIQSSDLLTFAVPLEFPSLISAPAVHVTGFLRGQHQIRRRTVQEIFTAQSGLTLNCTPICLGKGATLTSHPAFTAYIKKSTKDRAEATSNPNLLFRVHINGSTDNAQPKKRGPKGPI